jgi:hypothetical protein
MGRERMSGVGRRVRLLLRRIDRYNTPTMRRGENHGYEI